jgi:hypothetical protein
MKTLNWGALTLCTLLSTGLWAATPEAKDQLQSLHTINEQRTKVAQRSQTKIDKVEEERRALLDEYRSVSRMIEELQVYNRQLEVQTEAQQRQITALSESITEATQMKRQVTPLMLEMLATLEQFISLDIPFHLGERQQRLVFIQDAMDNPQVNDAEKFRQLLEAYQIENEYGRKIDSYIDTIEVNGQPINVNVLRVGRIALLAQTKDQQQSWRWDNQLQQWQPLDNDYRKPVRHAIRIARQQAAPDLLMLPVSAPQGAQEAGNE